MLDTGATRGLSAAEFTALRERRERAAAHARLCRALPPVKGREAEALIAEFLARGGQVTACPPRYALPTVAAA